MAVRWRTPSRLLPALLAVCALALAACGGGDGDRGSSPAAEKTAIRVAYAFGFDLRTLADRIAFDAAAKRAGVEFELRELGNPVSAVGVLQRGDADMVMTSLVGTATAVSEGADLRIVLVGRNVVDFVLAAKGAERLDDLRGKSVGFHAPATESAGFAQVVANRVGSEDDVKLVPLPQSSNRAAAVVAGRLDSAWIDYADYLRIAREDAQVKLLLRGADLLQFDATGVFVVTRAFAEEHRELLQEIVAGMLEGYATLYEEGGAERWVEQVAAEHFADVPDGRRLAEEVQRFDTEVGMWPRAGETVTREQWQSRTRFWRDEGILERAPAYEDVWDLSFWEKAGS